ncbi:Smr/MutS family protein [soil metagenome]
MILTISEISPFYTLTFFRIFDMAKLKLDLHDIYNKGGLIDRELENIIDEAIEKKIKTVEIIPGKGSGQLKKRVLKFLDQKHIKEKYHRIDKDSKNFGRLFVYFKF